MGFSVSAAATVLFIASVIAFSTVIGAVYDMEGGMHEARAAIEAMARESGETHISIVGIDRAAGSITVLNDGSAVLDPRHVRLFLNGTMIDPSALSYEVEGIPDTIFFNPGESMSLHAGRSMNDTLVQVMAGNGFKAVSQ